jgi:hypothetical protein
MEIDRRAIFREYIRRFNPAGDPATALHEGLYVPSPEGTAAQLAPRFDIDGTSSHLILGGVGSGKTTELMALKQMLDSYGGTHGLFLDVPAAQKMSTLREGVLLAHAWTEIAASVRSSGGPAEALAFIKDSTEVEHAIRGYWQDPDDYGFNYELPGVHVGGLIVPPEQDETLNALSSRLTELVKRTDRHFVVLFDGFDRVPLTTDFTTMILQDVGLLTRAGVGTVVVGPQRLRFGLHRQFVERFTSVHVQGADVSEASGREFLDRIVAARADDATLSIDARRRLIQWSGGIVRDLISLARDAGQVAYAGGAERVAPGHVDAAADRFGRSLLLGTSATMVDRLIHLGRFPSQEFVEFTASNELDLELLALRLVIEVPSTPVRYIIHPTVRPLLSGLRKSA